MSANRIVSGPSPQRPTMTRWRRLCCKTPFRQCSIFWEAYERGIQKTSWGTSQFVDWAACEVLNRSEMVLSADVPSGLQFGEFSSRSIFRLFQRNPPVADLGRLSEKLKTRAKKLHLAPRRRSSMRAA